MKFGILGRHQINGYNLGKLKDYQEEICSAKVSNRLKEDQEDGAERLRVRQGKVVVPTILAGVRVLVRSHEGSCRFCVSFSPAAVVKIAGSPPRIFQCISRDRSVRWFFDLFSPFLFG